MFTPSMQLDIVAYSSRGEVVLLAEIKGSRNTDGEWAAQFRRNLLSHGTLPNALFFLIATPEHMYFWKRDDSTADDALPHRTLDTTVVLRRYFDRFKQSPDTLSREALEWMFSYWFDDIIAFGKAGFKDDPSFQWLSDSGFFDALAGGRLQLNGI
jgi:hypothetical protein